MGMSPHAIIHNVEISQQGVLNLLLNHESHKSFGPDKIGALLLKNAFYEIAPMLKHIYFSNLSLVVFFPYAYVSPIYKRGSSADPKSYHPILLTSLVCKVMERISS